MQPNADHAADVERVFRGVYGQAVATLVRVFGDIGAAEDAVQDAFVTATARWQRDGIPVNPGGWIITVARNRAIDQLRRSSRSRELTKRLRPPDGAIEAIAEAEQRNDSLIDGAVADDRLRLMFTCCHPALRTEHQVALTLRLLGGLTLDEIARGFLVTEAAMAKRLVRAKFKIKAANIAYRVPDKAELPARLRPLLSVLYLIYSSGTAEPTQGATLRTEAIRLTRALVTLMPNEPETAGLLALLLLNESRIDASRRNGSLVLLRDQDRGRWDRELIVEGHAIVRRCIAQDQPGPYQLQAAIQAVHCAAPSFESTDWRQIVTLYHDLYAVMPTPVVALNKAIAITEVEGAEIGLDLLNTLESELTGYGPFHAARAAVLETLGRTEQARQCYLLAAELATSTAQRAHLTQQARNLSDLDPR